MLQSLNCTGSVEWCVNLSKCTFYVALQTGDNSKQKLTKFMTLATVIPKKVHTLILSNGKINTRYFSKDLDMAGMGNRCLLYFAMSELNIVLL